MVHYRMDVSTNKRRFGFRGLSVLIGCICCVGLYFFLELLGVDQLYLGIGGLITASGVFGFYFTIQTSTKPVQQDNPVSTHDEDRKPVRKIVALLIIVWVVSVPPSKVTFPLLLVKVPLLAKSPATVRGLEVSEAAE